MPCMTRFSIFQHPLGGVGNSLQHYNLLYQNLRFCRVPIMNPISGSIIRTYKKSGLVGLARLETIPKPPETLKA